jgi:hypothetical protein
MKTESGHAIATFATASRASGDERSMGLQSCVLSSLIGFKDLFNILDTRLEYLSMQNLNLQ